MAEWHNFLWLQVEGWPFPVTLEGGSWGGCKNKLNNNFQISFKPEGVRGVLKYVGYADGSKSDFRCALYISNPDRAIAGKSKILKTGKLSSFILPALIVRRWTKSWYLDISKNIRFSLFQWICLSSTLEGIHHSLVQWVQFRGYHFTKEETRA